MVVVSKWDVNELTCELIQVLEFFEPSARRRLPLTVPTKSLCAV